MTAIHLQPEKTSPARGIRYRTRLGTLNGAPAVLVNDKPMFLNAPYLAKAPYETFAEVGTGIYLLHDHQFAVEPDGSVDTGKVEKLILALLDREPGALIVIRSFPPAPQWWLDQNPDETNQFDRPLENVPDVELYRDASLASDLWLKNACRWYTTWCGWLHNRFSGQVIGHEFGMGAHGENGAAGAPSNDGRWFCGDFSPAMARYFRSYLASKYGSDEALRKAWGQPEVTLATAQVPDCIERQRSEWFTFRSPLRAQTSDYYLAYSERIQQTVITICQAIKDATHGECLAGSHLGAFMDNGFHGAMLHQIGTNHLRRALEHPAVDTFTSPASYEFRDPGGDANTMMPAGSIALHGKLIFQDQDTRTSILPPGYRSAFLLGSIAADLDESEHVLKRDFAHALIRGYGLWWHSMAPGMYDHPRIRECLRRLASIGRASLHVPRGIAANCAAMIVDEQSAAYQQCANRLFYPMLYHQRQRFWNRSGLAWNTYLHDDLDHPSMPRHKLYYFLNTFFLTDAEIKAIRHHLNGSGATVVWSYAPGIQSPSGFDLERVCNLTGFRLKALDIEALPQVTITSRDHPYVTGIDTVGKDPYLVGDQIPVTFGTNAMGGDDRERAIGPVIYVDDPDATVLGELSCIREPGFCVKEMDGWTSVYSAAPMINQYLLRNIGRSAGLHVWSTGDDVVLAGQSFLMIHAGRAGEKKLQLPNVTDVYECYDNRMVGQDLSEIRESMESHATALYFLGNQEQFEVAMRE